MIDLSNVEIALEAARSWDQKGDANWARRNYASALLGYLRAAVQEAHEAAAVELLRRHHVPELLATWAERDETLVAEVEAGRLPAAVLGGSYEPLVFHHMATLAGRPEIAAHAARTAARDDVKRLSTKFWAEYARAVAALTAGEAYEARPLAKLRGLETYWAPYLDLVADLTHGRDPAATLVRVDDAFERRSRDRRLADDAHLIEGTGRDPVRWDFRRSALLAAGS